MKPVRLGREMDVVAVEQQESKEVTRTRNNSEQDSGIRKCEKKFRQMERRETEPKIQLKSG